MRSGHCLILKHKARIGISEPSNCSCGVEADWTLYSRLVAFFPTPLRMAEILSEPQLAFQVKIAAPFELKSGNP